MTLGRAWMELGLLVGMLELYFWTNNKRILPKPVRLAEGVVVILLIVWLLYRQWPSRRTCGLAPRSWFSGWWSLSLATISGAALVFGIGQLAGLVGITTDIGGWIAGNWPIDIAQQVLLQVILVTRLRVIMRREDLAVSLMAAGIFALLHAPNPPLMALTAVAGIYWCEWFRRHENLLAVSLSHMVLAATAIYSLGPALHSLRIGFSYFTYVAP
ncbi:CAAX amino terminal protease self- immunity [Planctomycetes bacterium Pan216]|uniref:CAAX amino terminal protease self-immunity n=1 Tax=Kolteria novifilia TaxID=2527975 RepID=A0A518BBM9_9BACT|nr:CAAX amino terminal protease self- immunity [Planctomycetes bacterium Pan216]